MIAWFRQMPRGNPLLAFLPFPMLLYFWSLGRLSPWGDEAYAFQTMRLPMTQVLSSLAHDFHPPLYYLLLYAWQRLPLDLPWEVQARALSGVLALAATIAADRLWAARLPERGRLAFLAVWSCSPCLVLYARMCHSFTLQLLVGTVVAALILRFAQERSLRHGAWLAAGLIVALYTHYVPGLALLAAANLALTLRRRWSDALRLDAVVGVAYLPWVWWLVHALGGWASHPPSYFLTGAALPELAVKLAYWAMTFVMGEAQPDAVLAGGALLILLALVLVASGARRNPTVFWLLAPLAVMGFAGVSRWLAYPFIAPRMLFLYPLVLLLFVEGALAHRRAGPIAVTAVLLVSITGVWSYWHGTGFRNKQYLMPLREIAAEIQQQSSPGDALVLVDTPNSDIVALEYCLHDSRRVVATQDPAAAQALADPRLRTVWFLRNTHDATSEKLDDRFEQRLRAGMRDAAVEKYEKFSPLERWAMRRAGMDPPEYFQELWRFRR